MVIWAVPVNIDAVKITPSDVAQPHFLQGKNRMFSNAPHENVRCINSRESLLVGFFENTRTRTQALKFESALAQCNSQLK